MSLGSDMYDVIVLDCAWYVIKNGGLGWGVTCIEG